jgi:peptidoglycan/LPS O-acetylase OafA/YrhL
MYGNKARIPQLDGIRGLAILLVLCWHYFAGVRFQPENAYVQLLKNMLSLSWSGVDLFFVLSGFLIGGILMDHRESKNYFKVFYIRRICRIFPMYFVLLLGFLLLKSVIDHDNNPGADWLFAGFPSLWPYVAFAQNFFMSFGEALRPPSLAITWSLSVEEQFYLILPFVLRAIPHKKVPHMCLFLIVSAPVIRTFIMVQPYFHNSAAFVLLPSRMDSLLIGVLGAWMLRDKKIHDYFRKNIEFIKKGCLILAAGAMLFAVGRFGVLSMAMTPIGYTWLALMYLGIIYVGLLSEDGWTKSILMLRPLRWLGCRSYAIYLFHQLILGTFHYIITGSGPSLTKSYGYLCSLLALITTILFAELSWFLVEKPFLCLGRRFHYEVIEYVYDKNLSSSHASRNIKKQMSGFASRGI